MSSGISSWGCAGDVKQRAALLAFLHIIALVSIIASLLTGERINFLIRACSSMLAAVAWRPKLVASWRFWQSKAPPWLWRYGDPGLLWRFFTHLVSEIPTHGDSPYFRAMAPGWLAFQEAPLFGIGPGNLRLLCDDIIAGSSLYDCHPHPHNFYLQMLGEAGIIGFLTGVLFLGSVIWACARPALRDRRDVVVATMWIVPFGFLADRFHCRLLRSVEQYLHVERCSCGAGRRADRQPGPVRHKDLITPRSVSASSPDSTRPQDRSGLRYL